MAGYQTKKREMKAEINVVPYIDVMLVLLIIFMVTSPFVTQGVDVELPKTHSAKSAQDLAVIAILALSLLRLIKKVILA